MGITYWIDKAAGISYVVWDGVITADEFLTQAQLLVSDPIWPAQRRIHMVDTLTASLDASVDDAALSKAAQIYSENQDKLANTKIAVAASGIFMNALRFEGMMSANPMTMIVFNSLETACLWLGIDSAETSSILQELRVRLRKGKSP